MRIPRESWRSFPFAVTCPPANSHHHRSHLPDSFPPRRQRGPPSRFPPCLWLSSRSLLPYPRSPGRAPHAQCAPPRPASQAGRCAGRPDSLAARLLPHWTWLSPDIPNLPRLARWPRRMHLAAPGFVALGAICGVVPPSLPATSYSLANLRRECPRHPAWKKLLLGTLRENVQFGEQLLQLIPVAQHRRPHRNNASASSCTFPFVLSRLP